MVRLESRRARTASRRMRFEARATVETIDVGSSDEGDNNEDDGGWKSSTPPASVKKCQHQVKK